MIITVSRMSLVSAVERLVPITPAKPIDPAYGLLRFVASGEHLIVDATDGELKARVTVPLEDGEGMDVLPALKLHEIVKAGPAGEDPVIIDTTDRARATIRIGQALFTIPLHSSTEFPSFPSAAVPDEVTDGATTTALFNTDEFVSACGRVAYAMGGPQAKPEARMVCIADGTAVAYSGRRVQEALLDSHGSADPILIRDEALQPLLRFLRQSGQVGVTSVTPVEYPVSEDRVVLYYVVICNDAAFAFPRPASEFVDLTRTWQLAGEQREGAGVLEIERSHLLEAIRAARVQADPREPRLAIDLNGDAGEQRLWARIDAATEFEAFIPATYTTKEKKPRTIAMSLDDIQAMAEAYPEPGLSLAIAPAKYANGRSRPLVQLFDVRGEREARAIISQTEAP